MKKIFIDLGCNKLQGLYHTFKNKLGIDESWVIRCFEANVDVYNHALDEINHFRHQSHIFSKYPDFKIENAAISDKDGIEQIKNIVEFTVDNETRQGDAGGSTLLDDVVWHQENIKYQTMNVASIDINTLVEQLVEEYGKQVEIYIKCDIEGYEYKVIRRLITSKHLDKIRHVYIEWHPHFFKNEKDKKAEAFDLMRGLFIPKGNLDVSLHY